MWVILPDFPIQCWKLKGFMVVANSIGSFMHIEYAQLLGFYHSAPRLMVDMDLSNGLPDDLEVLWDGGSFTQNIDYWKIYFRCHYCRMTGHSKEFFPSKGDNHTGPRNDEMFCHGVLVIISSDKEITFLLPLDRDSTNKFVGDLNFIWSFNEVWGVSIPCDLQGDYFISLFEDSNLQDIAPAIISHTWYNGRVGPLSIAKRLDHFFLDDNLCESLGNFKTCHHSNGVSDHWVVILQMDFDRAFIIYPFKFNPTWLSDEEFNVLIRKEWALLSYASPSHLSPMKALLQKLRKL